MANTIRIKRRSSGNAGAPTSLENAELAYNEVDDVLYYGKGTGGAGGTATSVEAIGGAGAYLTLSGAQTVTGNKTFSGTVTVPTPTANTDATTKEYVDGVVANSTISFTVAGDSGNSQVITTSDTFTVSGGTGLSSVMSSPDTVTVNLDNTTVVAGAYGSNSSVATFTVDEQGRLTAAGNASISISSSQIQSFEEVVQDAAASLFTISNHQGISATYNDSNNAILLNVNDFTITLGGDLTGNVTINDLNSATLNATIAANSVALGTDTTGDYVSSINGGTNIIVSNSSGESSVHTISTTTTPSFSQVQLTPPAVGNTQNADTNFMSIITIASNTLLHNTIGYFYWPTTDNRSITFPDASGTVVLSNSSPTLTGATVDNIQIGITTTNTIDTISGGLTIGSADGNVTVNNNLIISGDLTVQGNTTTLNTATLVVEDKNIVLANVATPDDTTADGAGISILGATTKTFNWVDTTDAWTSSEHLDLASGKGFYIGGASVLSNTTLGSSVVNSSLTSVGTLTSGTWNASVIGAIYGGTGINSYTTGDIIYSSASNTLAKLAIGTTGQLLKVVAGVPTWSDELDGGSF